MEQKGYMKNECGMCESACGQCDMRDECGGCGMACQQMYGMRCGGRHHLLRWVLGILIIVLIFIAGIKMGEFKERAWGGMNGYRMMNRAYEGMPAGYGGMMQWRAGADGGVCDRYGMMRGAGVNASPVAPVQ